MKEKDNSDASEKRRCDKDGDDDGDVEGQGDGKCQCKSDCNIEGDGKSDSEDDAEGTRENHDKGYCTVENEVEYERYAFNVVEDDSSNNWGYFNDSDVNRNFDVDCDGCEQLL